MKFTTIVPPKTKTFSAQNRQWEYQAPAWLREKHSSGFGCSAIHTLQVEEGGRVAVFHIFVAEAMPNLPPLPAKITDCWEAGSQLGNVVIADCETSPPTIRIHENFWAGPSPEHESHFKLLVRPIMDRIIARFGKGEAWVS